MTDSESQGKSKRVLVAQNVPQQSWGGMARMMRSMHGALQPFGWQVEYFSADDMEKIRSARLRRHTFAWYVRRHVRAAFLAGKPYGIVNVHEPAGAAVVLARERLGNPAVVAMSHGIEQRYWELCLGKYGARPEIPTLKQRIGFPLAHLWQSWLTLHYADHVFCMNQEDRAFLEGRHHRAPQTITNVFPGAGPEFAAVFPERSYVRPCTKLVFAGTWVERKGIRQVVEAFSTLAANDATLRLGVLGAGATPERVLADFPQPLRSRITVHPPLSHPDSAALLLDYDLYLLPSYHEGMPATLIEAMCTGLPVIAARNSGMKDVVRDGENGLLVTAGNTAELVRALQTLLNDRAMRERLGRQGHADATQKYTWDALARIVNQAYSGLLQIRESA
jgi:glycosyltransferase involved in cell wall biosynthesis